MGEIRFVGTGETRGYPYLVCKKSLFLNVGMLNDTCLDKIISKVSVICLCVKSASYNM